MKELMPYEEINHPLNWNKEINELETFFNSTELTTNKIILNQSTIIIDVSKFVTSHLAIVKANNGKRKFLPCLIQIVFYPP